MLLSFSFQANAEKGVKQLKGSVVEMDSGEKIKGAIITVEKDGEVIQSIVTDESGNFELNYDETHEKEGELKIKISKPGFTGKNIEPSDKSCCEMKFELKKKPKRKKPMILPAGPSTGIEI